MLNNSPYYRAINLIVSMNQMMAHISNVLPRNLRISTNKLWTEFIGCFSYNHSIVNNTTI